MSGLAPTVGPLTNQMGTGVIPVDKERELLARGIQFAAYLVSPNGSRCLITSCHGQIYQRLGEQLSRLADEDRGLPLAYRIPVPSHSVSLVPTP